MKCLGFLILLTSLSLVSGLCSTCLEERCYDNGECVIGCVPGYVGQYCDEDCPSRCLNKACHVHIDSGAITCTDGCEPGYCDIKCEVECPGECATCDRQCRSCNVTLCPERRYGADCGEKCTGRYGKCDSETGQCIRCTRGYYGDECDQMCPGCFTLADNLYDTCLSGCDICQTEGTCKVGFYGDSCELKCSTGCKNPGGCNRATGECDRCVSGYHGLTCNYTCSSLCEGWVCNQSDGVCTSGCISGYKTNLDMCEKYDNEDICKVGFYGDSCKLKCSTGCKNQGGCNRATGECSDGCVSGYHGLICDNMCSSFCVGGVCNQHDGVCTFGCISGYKTNLDMCEKYDNEDICKVGFYGDSCKLKCPTGCKNQGGCNRATGECSDGCVSGYHGLICNNMCSSFCVGGVCNQHDGVCTFGCISGYKTNLDMCEKYDNEGFNTTVAIAVLIIVLICLVVGMVTAVVIWRIRRSRRWTNQLK